MNDGPDTFELPAADSSPPGAPGFSAQQAALMRALGVRDRSLSEMYHGAIRVLGDQENPDRFAQCAHSVRELMEKLPEILDVPTKALKENLKPKVSDLKMVYLRVRDRTNCFSTNGWVGSIDGHLRTFLQRAEEFFDWFVKHHPTRREELHGALVKMEGSNRELPAPLALRNVDYWEEMRNYFQAVAHHRKESNEQELNLWLDALERFLLDRLAPRTFSDFSAIDAIIQKGEGNA